MPLRYDLSLYPPMKCGLEVNCGDGLSIRNARSYNTNLWGLNPVVRLEWIKYAIDPFCKIGTADSIPYPDGFFDFVFYTEELPVKYGEILKEFLRVTNDKIAVKVKLTKDNDESWWINSFVNCGLYPEVLQMLMGNLIHAELRKNWL